MRKINILLILVLSISLVGIGCKKGGSAGAATPEDLFAKMKGIDQKKMSAITDFVAPDELALLAFSLDMGTAMLTAFSKDKTVTADYKKIREKYKLPDTSKTKLNIKDPASVEKYANENYAKIDIKGFLTDIEKIMEKASPGTMKGEEITYAELKDVKTEGDKATGTAVLGNKKTEKLTFLKVNGKWYLSIKAQMKMM
ncbi:MAG: hypothetical protein GY754_08370 [bacterium]|nr:hypothetical protein [bacterium]